MASMILSNSLSSSTFLRFNEPQHQQLFLGSSSRNTPPFLQLHSRKLKKSSRGLSVVRRAGGGISSSSYIFALIFPLSLLAITIFTSARIADNLDKKFLEELFVPYIGHYYYAFRVIAVIIMIIVVFFQALYFKLIPLPPFFFLFCWGITLLDSFFGLLTFISSTVKRKKWDYFELAVNKAIMEGEEDDGIVVTPLEEKPATPRTRNRPKREVEPSSK